MTHILGIIGALTLLVSFIGATRPHAHMDHSYFGANIVGAGLLMWYAYSIDSWAFFLLEAIWLAFSAYKYWKLPKKQEASGHH